MSARAIVCSNCGAGLDPRILETKVKCTYCETVFAIVRDRDGVSGLASEDQAPDHRAGPAPGSTPWSAPAAGAPAPGTIAGLDPQTIARIEQDTLLVLREGVKGLELVESIAGGRGVARRGCLGAVLLVVSLAGAALIALA